jgi:hypothetical protein
MHKPLEKQYIIHRRCNVSQALFGYHLESRDYLAFVQQELVLYIFARKYGMFDIAEADARFLKKD